MFNEQVQSVIVHVDEMRNHVDDHWQIPRDEAELLAQLVIIGRCVSVCEIGTSYAFSTLHLAAATRLNDGFVHAFELSEKKINAATEHLTCAGLIETVRIHQGDAREEVGQFEPEKPYDFVFIDAVKDQSFEYLEVVTPKLAQRAILVTDNTTSHADQLTSFVQHLREIPNARSCGVDVGNGFELTIVDRK